MEDQELKDPARYKNREELLSELVKLSASEETANSLIDASKDLTVEFTKNFKDLTNKFLNDLRSNLEDKITEIDGDRRGMMIGLIGFNAFHEIVCVMLTGCAEVASLGRVGLPDFVKHAAQHYERAAVKDTVEMMTSSLLEMIMRSGTEPSKEDLS